MTDPNQHLQEELDAVRAELRRVKTELLNAGGELGRLRCILGKEGTNDDLGEAARALLAQRDKHWRSAGVGVNDEMTAKAELPPRVYKCERCGVWKPTTFESANEALAHAVQYHGNRVEDMLVTGKFPNSREAMIKHLLRNHLLDEEQ